MSLILTAAQVFFFGLGGYYFLCMIKGAVSEKKGIKEEDKREAERINKEWKVSLGKPLTERARPERFDEIVGQEKAIEALRIALCGKNPQHILIYGPAGVGKTTAARAALAEAKKSAGTPFAKDAKFIEIDATCLRYDERSFADPLIGSVHDPIYQGSGAYGSFGIPQPKPGAVSDAHGGVLFIDEIGELERGQMNKLLKVLEDRKVRFESAYYSRSDKNIPHYIHAIFRDGLPADFRLIGATTRSPSEIPTALRTRCTEIFFLPLGYGEIISIINSASEKIGIKIEKQASECLALYTANGRDAVKILENIANLLDLENRETATKEDVLWAIRSGRFERKRGEFCKVAKKKTKTKKERSKIVDLLL